MAQQRRVVIQNAHGENLVGILHDTGSNALVIVCHGFKSSKEGIPMVSLAAAFEKEWISVFRFDFAGNGESEGSFQYGNYYREADDLRAVVLHFHGKKHVTAIIGHSKGGNVVLLYASKYKDIHTVVNISGRFNLKRGIEDRLGKDFLQRIQQKGFIDVKNRRGMIEYRVTKESLMDRLTTEVRATCLSIHGDCRVLTVHGSMDKIVPADDAFAFSKSIANHDLWIIEMADHDYMYHQDVLASVVVNFIKANLHVRGQIICTFPMAVAQQHRVVIQNRHGEKLVGILHDTGSDDLVIVCHGLQSSKDYTPMVKLAAAFEKEWISVFRFDFAGNGESEGSFHYGNYRREADDLRAVVQHFHGKKHMVTTIIGHSKGGNVVLLYASLYKDIDTVVSISGRFDLKKGIEGRFGKDFLQRIRQKGFIDVKNRRGKFEYRVTEESLRDQLTIEVCATCLSIPGSCRVLTVHGSMDKHVLVGDAVEFSKSIANHDLYIIQMADHDYTLHQDELASVVVNFVKANIHLHKVISKQQHCRMLERGGPSRF